MSKPAFMAEEGRAGTVSDSAYTGAVGAGSVGLRLAHFEWKKVWLESTRWLAACFLQRRSCPITPGSPKVRKARAGVEKNYHLIRDGHFEAIVPCVEQVARRKGKVDETDLACLRARLRHLKQQQQ